uniref:Snaclec salmorin subunit B n=1 Tax=Gloydius brevicauda TaxID=3148161 RepID=SLB_GLOBR|nr:RecName: Full=Snaclec salmorin subunit B; Flags: Precursor [Gloydius brevicaudus]AAD18056.1 fibrinogen clotting inhibitor B chain [Gloydius brevicaudus]
MGRFIFVSFGLLVVFVSLSGTGADCPSGWSSYEGHCYKLFNQQSQWAHAEKFCTLQHTGGHLVSFHSTEEADFVVKLAFQNFGHGIFWMGLSNVWNQCSWQWSNAAKLKYEAWAEIYCVYFKSTNNKWRSRACRMEAYFVCEFQA